MARTLGSVAVGEIVKLKESGTPQNYIVVHQGKPDSMYDSSCDGTWLLRQDLVAGYPWDGNNSNVLETSTIQTWLNSTMLEKYDSDIQDAIKQVKVPYLKNGNNGPIQTGSNGLSCKVFFLSNREVGFTSNDGPYFPNDGAKLSYFVSGNDSSAKQKRIARLNRSASNWYTRSPYARSDTPNSVWMIDITGGYVSSQAFNYQGVRPALVLPSTLLNSDDGTIITNTAPTSPSNITVPGTAFEGDQITVSWSASSDKESNLSGYTLQRLLSNGSWTQVYKGSSRSFKDSALPVGTTSVQYRVQAYDSLGLTSSWATSNSIKVLKPITKPTLLGKVQEGSLVKLNESGSPIEFYVAKQNYESGLNGAGRVLLVRKDVHSNGQWNVSNVNTYANSTIDQWFNSTYKDLLDSWAQEAIGTTKFYYTPGNGNNTVTTLEREVFAVSLTELGLSLSNANSEGTGLPISELLKIASSGGTRTSQWTRSPTNNSTASAMRFDINGNSTGYVCTNSSGYRPSFTVPNNLIVLPDGTLSPGSTITIPALIIQGNTVPVSWTAIDGADSYTLQRKADSGEWEQIYSGSDTSFTDTAGDWSTVQYQVQAVFDGVPSAWSQSLVVEVVSKSAVAISGSDGDLGTIISDIGYSVSTDTGKKISLTRTVNGVLVARLEVDSGFAYSIPVMDLPTGTGTIVITATVQTDSDPVTVTRTWTYTKQAQTFPGSGGVAQLTQDGQEIFPLTLAEAVKPVGGPWGANLGTALDKLALAATYTTAGDFADLWGNIIPTVKIETGSYTGTGTYGSSNPNKLTFGFEPKLVLVFASSSLESFMIIPAFAGNPDGNGSSFIIGGSNACQVYPVSKNVDGNSLNWWVNGITQPHIQFNHSGRTYNYIAIG